MLDALLAFDVAHRRMKAQFEMDVGAGVEARGAEREVRSRSGVVSALAVRLLGRRRRRIEAASAARSRLGARPFEPKRP